MLQPVGMDEHPEMASGLMQGLKLVRQLREAGWHRKESSEALWYKPGTAWQGLTMSQAIEVEANLVNLGVSKK